MQFLTAYVVVLVATLLCFPHLARAQSKATKEGTGSLSGRVTLDGEPKAGVVVSLLHSWVSGPPGRSALARTTTDADGRYRLHNLPAGNFNATVFAPGFLIAGTGNPASQPGRPVTLGVGETVENFDVALTPGGVITGRITNAEGKPVIAERVNLWLHQAQGRPQRSFANNNFGMQTETDDHGVYRIYGLAPSSYLVSAGLDPNDSSSIAMHNTSRSQQYQLTYHPDASEAAQAKVVAVTPGGEATDIDITLGARTAGHQVLVRVVDAATGRPVPNVEIAIGRRQDNSFTSVSTANRTDANGQLRIERLLPGRYVVFLANWRNDNDLYGEPAAFEVTDGGLEGVELRVRRGATISGLVTFEGVKDPALLAVVASLRVATHTKVENSATDIPTNSSVRLNPDGSFLLRGLPPGKQVLSVHDDSRTGRFALVRVEHNGVLQRDGIATAAGANVTGVRLALAYASGVVRGQVQAAGGALPANLRMNVRMWRADGLLNTGLLLSEVDQRGHFLLENVLAGEYKLQLNAYLQPTAPGEWGRGLPPIDQQITVTDGGEVRIVLTLDLTANERRQ